MVTTVSPERSSRYYAPKAWDPQVGLFGSENPIPQWLWSTGDGAALRQQQRSFTVERKHSNQSVFECPLSGRQEKPVPDRLRTLSPSLFAKPGRGVWRLEEKSALAEAALRIGLDLHALAVEALKLRNSVETRELTSSPGPTRRTSGETPRAAPQGTSGNDRLRSDKLPGSGRPWSDIFLS